MRTVSAKISNGMSYFGRLRHFSLFSPIRFSAPGLVGFSECYNFLNAETPPHPIRSVSANISQPLCHFGGLRQISAYSVFRELWTSDLGISYSSLMHSLVRTYFESHVCFLEGKKISRKVKKTKVYFKKFKKIAEMFFRRN